MKADVNFCTKIMTCCFASKSKKICTTYYADSRGIRLVMSKAKQLKKESVNLIGRKTVNKRAQGTDVNPLKEAPNRYFCQIRVRGCLPSV